MKTLIEGFLVHRGKIVKTGNVPGKTGRIPHKRERMIIPGKCPFRQGGRTAGLLMVSTSRREMNCAVDFIRLLSEQFHDVNFSTQRPTAVLPIGREHPYCGPQSLTVRKLSANIKPAVSPIAFHFRSHPG